MNVAVPYPYFVRIGASGLNSDNPAVAPLSEVIMPWPNTISLLMDLAKGGKDAKNAPKQTAGSSTQNGVTGMILAQSSQKSWTASGSIDLNPQQQWHAPSATALKPYTLAAYLSGSFKSYFAGKSVPPVKEAAKTDSLSKISLQPIDPADANRTIVPNTANGHLVVVANSDFVSAQNAAPQNLTMVMNLVDWLSQDDNLISIRTRSVQDRTINADLLQKGSSTPSVIRFINIITMPLLVIIAGLLIFFRRREHVAPVPTSPTGASGEKTEEKRT